MDDLKVPEVFRNLNTEEAFPSFDSVASRSSNRMEPPNRAGKMGCGTGCLFVILGFIGFGVVGQMLGVRQHVADPAQPATEVAAPIETHFDIRVESKSVKKIAEKFRYSFEVSNHGKPLHAGSVTVFLLDQSGKVLDWSPFEFPLLAASEVASQSFESNVSPVRVDRFSYGASDSKGFTVSKGESSLVKRKRN